MRDGKAQLLETHVRRAHCLEVSKWLWCPMNEIANPVLVELTRGGLVESRHRGAVAVVGPDGIMLALGDVERPVFPRSAIKALQAVPLVTTGAADRFGLTDEHLALACASHSGADYHVKLAAEMLAKGGMTADALACGAHRPLDGKAAARLIETRTSPSQLHNNCSGKHAGMLLTAVHCGEPANGYLDPDHPVQRRIRDVLETLTGERLGASVCGIDGCGVPNWAVSARGLATAFQRYVSGTAPVGAAAVRIMAACWKYPEAVAGEGRLDTTVMRRHPGEVFLKTGAEGVYCAAVRSRGLGVALKIDDGAKRASEAAVMAVLSRLTDIAADVMPDGAIANWRGRRTGETRISEAFRDALTELNAR
ncbi:MAG: hypothetical protein RLZ98_2882 [Pseudomonadota bacterium]